MKTDNCLKDSARKKWNYARGPALHSMDKALLFRQFSFSLCKASSQKWQWEKAWKSLGTTKINAEKGDVK